jgi:hypothetical protein
MPQELQQMLNPWARFRATPEAILEPQRSDLFTVDLSAALRRIQSLLAESGSSTANALAAEFPRDVAADMRYYVNGVEFPEARIGMTTVKRHDNPYPWPGPDEVAGSLAMTFTQEISVAEEPVSGIAAFLYGWRAIVRAGRAGAVTGDAALGLLDAGRRAGGGLIPDYKHDFYVEQWRGSTMETSTDEPGQLQLSHRWKVLGAWISGIQSNSIRHAQAQVQELRATFQVDAIVPALIPGGNTSFGPLVNLGTVAFNPQEVNGLLPGQ